jgi:hypothetical protein
MKSTRGLKSVRILLLAVLAAGLSASLASAQEYEGKFTLPFVASWGMPVLPAGDYSFRVNASQEPCRVSLSQEGRGVPSILTSNTTRGEVAGSSALIPAASARGYRIRALRLAEAGALRQTNQFAPVTEPSIGPVHIQKIDESFEEPPGHPQTQVGRPARSPEQFRCAARRGEASSSPHVLYNGADKLLLNPLFS